MVPNVVKKIYGKDYGTQAYGIMFTYTSLASILMIILQTQFLSESASSFNLFFYLNGTFSGISLIILILFFREDKYFKEE